MFVTQSVDSSVTVLVFSRPGPVADGARSALQAKHLEVVVVDPFAFSPATYNQLEQQQFYKICWFFDDTTKGTAVADHIFQFLFTRTEPVMVVTSTLGSEAVSAEWTTKKDGDGQLLDHFKHYLPQANVLLVINWIDQPELYVSPTYFFSDPDAASRSLKSGVVTREILEVVVKHLIRPSHSKVEKLERTRQFSRADLEQYFAKKTPSVVAESLPIPKRVELEVEESVSENVEENVAYRIQSSEKTVELSWQVAEFESLHQDVNVKVLPVTAPKISNRQRLYEQNMSKIKQRYQKQKLLKPVSKKVSVHKEATSVIAAQPELQPLEKNLEMTIQQLFGSQRLEQRQDRLQKKAVKTARAQRKQVRQKKVMRLLYLVIFLAIVSGSVFGSFMWMRTTLYNLILSQAEVQNLADQEVWQSKKTQFLVHALATEVQAYQLIGGSESLPETTAVLSAVRQMQTIHHQRQELQKLTEKSVAQVLGKEKGDVFTTVNDVAAQQQTLYSSLSVIQTQLQGLTTEFMDDREKVAVEMIMTEIQQARKQVATFEQIRQLVPSLLAQNERRRIGIILQDSQELRPSGGVIQGVYLITLEKGQIIDQQFYDTKQLEGDKSAVLPAPTDYKKYLGQDNLQLIDAGWSADFSETATMVNGLLDHSLGRKADFMVGLTTNSLHKIISRTGPLALDETNETLTEKNFFERLESHPENEYLQTVLVTLMDRLLAEPVQAEDALAVIAGELQEGQAFLVSAQQTENEVLNTLGWAGQVSTPQCPSLLGTENCQISTIYQIESNIGLNKLGSLIERQIQHTVSIGKEQIKHQRIMTITNEATSSRWPTGAYKDYIRFYIPSGSEITRVRVGESDLDLKSLDRGETKNGQFVGFVANVPVHSRVEVLVEYQQEFSYSPDSSFAFFDQKQAGTEPDEYRLIINPEDGLVPAVVAPKAEIKDGNLIFEQPREKHQFVGIKFR